VTVRLLPPNLAQGLHDVALHRLVALDSGLLEHFEIFAQGEVGEVIFGEYVLVRYRRQDLRTVRTRNGRNVTTRALTVLE
jgi:hypothetical protein